MWLCDRLLYERLVVSHNFYKADLETGDKARGYTDTCSERALSYAETLRNVGFTLGIYCRNWCSLCEVVCFCLDSLTGETEIGGSLEL